MLPSKISLLALGSLSLAACSISEPESHVEQALSRYQKHQSLNAIVYFDAQGARQSAAALADLPRDKRGPLHGVTLVVKDNIHVAGMPNSAGTKALAGFVPKQDAEVIRRVRQAGAIIVGKANLHELAYGITSNNYFTGAVANPHQPEYFAGGSSGGTAAAIAAGIVPMGLGTDTGGSSRIPAALTGIVGFRPSTGRYPNDGLTMISDTRDTVGPMATSVADIALLDSVLAAEPNDLPALKARDIRLGVPRAYFYQNLEPAVEDAMKGALSSLASAGVQLVEVDINDIESLNNGVSFPVVLHETKRLLTSYLSEHQANTSPQQLLAEVRSPDVKAVLSEALSGAVPGELYQQAIDVHRPKLQQVYQDYFNEHRLDAMVFPTTPLTARKIKGSDNAVLLNGKKVPTFAGYIRNTDPSSNAGIPGISLPIGKSAEGLPIGLELDGPVNSDRRLLAVAAIVEGIVQTADTKK